MLAVVLAGGELAPGPRVEAALRRADLVIAADSGARHAAALGCTIDVLIGDFDSWAPEAGRAGSLLSFPADKDLTDTHLAVREAVRRGATEIALLAAMRGPRLDHALANAALLAAPEFRGVDLRALDGPDELRCVRSFAAISGRPGDLVSLLPVTARTAGITTSGLRYVLSGGVLRRGETRGVSNELVDGEATVRVERGTLLLVHRLGGDPNRRQ